MTGKLSKNFHGVGIGPLSKILAVKKYSKFLTVLINSAKNPGKAHDNKSHNN